MADVCGLQTAGGLQQPQDVAAGDIPHLHPQPALFIWGKDICLMTDLPVKLSMMTHHVLSLIAGRLPI